MIGTFVSATLGDNPISHVAIIASTIAGDPCVGRRNPQLKMPAVPNPAMIHQQTATLSNKRAALSVRPFV